MENAQNHSHFYEPMFPELVADIDAEIDRKIRQKWQMEDLKNKELKVTGQLPQEWETMLNEMKSKGLV